MIAKVSAICFAGARGLRSLLHERQHAPVQQLLDIVLALIDHVGLLRNGQVNSTCILSHSCEPDEQSVTNSLNKPRAQIGGKGV